MTRFVQTREPMNSSYSGGLLELHWRVVEVDRVWRRVMALGLVECFSLMQYHLERQLGQDVQLVVINLNGQDPYNSLHPDVLREYQAAVSADALKGIS